MMMVMVSLFVVSTHNTTQRIYVLYYAIWWWLCCWGAKRTIERIKTSAVDNFCSKRTTIANDSRVCRRSCRLLSSCVGWMAGQSCRRETREWNVEIEFTNGWGDGNQQWLNDGPRGGYKRLIIMNSVNITLWLYVTPTNHSESTTNCAKIYSHTHNILQPTNIHSNKYPHINEFVKTHSHLLRTRSLSYIHSHRSQCSDATLFHASHAQQKNEKK